MFAAIYLPDFSLQAALRHEPELFSRPVALLHDELKSIFQFTAVAHNSGVTAGLTATQALARCANVLIRPRSIPQEEATMNVLLECAYVFSPNIEATEPGVCTLDLQNLPVLRTAQRETALTEWGNQIVRQLAAFNLRVQVGVAENPDLALHAAKIARPFFLVKDSREFTAALPVESIEPSREILLLLKRWGIHTLGEFTALQKNNLAERLGAESLELFDRATANEVRPLNLIKPKEVFEESIELENEIETLDPLLFILRRFIEQLARRLELFHFVAEEIQLKLTLSSGVKYERSFHVPAPTRQIDILFRMLQTHLEGVRTDSAIIALHLTTKPGRAEHFQFGLFETALKDPNHFYETLAQLSSLLGADRVGTPIPENTHRPDAFRMERPSFDRRTTLVDDASKTEKSTAPGLPLRRFRPAIPAVVELRDHKPVLLHSKAFVGVITKTNGPFRSSGDWWEQQRLWGRDEWDIETANGSIYRIYRANEEWFLEGVFD